MSHLFKLVPVFLVTSCALAGSSSAPAQRSTPAVVSDALPVREATVFKDGHAFVLREGRPTLGADGALVLDQLPTPVLGTFWPYARGAARLVSATASRERVARERTALDLVELLEANVGREVDLVDADKEHVVGTLVGVPKRSAEERARTDGGADPALPEAGRVVLVRTKDATRAVPLDRVRDLAVKGELATRFTRDELAGRITLRFQDANGAPAQGATDVGLVYVQKGLRWIPSYKVDVDGAGKARVELQAAIVNDLVDLADATVNLVVGVPRFEFEELVDPIALQELAAQVGTRMQVDQGFSNYLSNSIMTQQAGFAPARGAPAASGPELSGGEAKEDLFVFTLRHVTLARGERMTVPVKTFELAYRDVYVLDVPMAPPMDVREQFQGERVRLLAQALAAPRVQHVLRFVNASGVPITTAPALVLAKGAVLAQGKFTYTPLGAETDLALTTAVDVNVTTTETESGRTPNAVVWSGDAYNRIDLAGTIRLVNGKGAPVELEVRRSVLGLVDRAEHDGVATQLGLSESLTGDRPDWWSLWSSPYWWWRWNGVGRFAWKLALKPGETVELAASWHYFWR